MPGSKSNYLEGKVIQVVFESNWDADTELATIKVALYLDSDKPTDSNAGTEITGGSYVRQSVTRATGWMSTGGATQNAADITFPEATADWGSVGAFALFDAAGTNMLYWGDLTTPKTINTGDTAKIAAGDIDITED
jgi:hypothetical protein